MSKKTFKRLVAQKAAEFRKWASMKGLTFKTTSEIERDKAARERERERFNKQRGDSTGGNRNSRGKNGLKKNKRNA